MSVGDTLTLIGCIVGGLACGLAFLPFARDVQRSTDDRRARINAGFAENNRRFAENNRRRAEATARLYESWDRPR